MAIVMMGWLGACAAAGATEPEVDPAPRPLPVNARASVPGEQMVWDVFWQGFQIGRAELRIGSHDARSLFTTTAMARALASVRHELTTSNDGTVNRGAHELVVFDGETRR